MELRYPYSSSSLREPSLSVSGSDSSMTISPNLSSGWQLSRVPGDVPTAVHALLLSTKQLQESLRLWSINQATETQVSDVYVQIGTQFNTTIHAFAYHKIDLSDIHGIPTDLRTVLEQCLAEDPSPQALAMYMPEVRRVLYKLLKGLQAKQDAWKAVGGRMPMMPSESR